MSVINKMLRDLDQRQAKVTVSSAARGLEGGLQAGTAALSSTPGAGQPRAWPARLVLACAGLALVIGASWWALQRVAMPTTAVDPDAAVAAAPVAPAALVPPTASIPLVVAPTAPLVASPASAPVLTQSPITAKPEAVAMPVPLVATLAGTLAAPAAPLTAFTRREPAALGLRMDTSLTSRKLADHVTVPDRALGQGSELPKGPNPNEALERAQALWNSGSRDAAIDLLEEAVVVAERVGAGGSSAQGNSVLLTLVRELTRMQLVESRYGAVWDLLTRLEPHLGTAPDLWAIRGNAAQRLGRHEDSVRAYMAALQSRPNEQRWLLGAAVSLAALGKTSSAAEMADKARAVGVVSPEVRAYLRQMGVPLKDK